MGNKKAERTCKKGHAYALAPPPTNYAAAHARARLRGMLAHFKSADAWPTPYDETARRSTRVYKLLLTLEYLAPGPI